jgi:prepilin-type N-terminal cleavage/methylation domain-containing protein
MVREPFPRIRPALGVAGFSAIELVVVVAVIGIIMAASAPTFFSYFRTAAVRAGAEEMSAVLNRARLLAIKDNTSMCVKNAGNRVRYFVGPCDGTVWTGPDTDAAGFIQLASNISMTTGQVTFTYIGTATAPASYTVTNPPDASSLTVNVTAAGRVSINP